MPTFDQTDETKSLSLGDLRDAWPVLPTQDRVDGFQLLESEDAEEFFSHLDAHDQLDVILGLPVSRRKRWMRLLAPDDAADVIQRAEHKDREGLLALLDESARGEVTGLLAYAEDDAGGLMNPRFARLRPDISVDEAISYLRKQTRERIENIYYTYVLDADQKLLGVTSFRDLFSAPGGTKVRDIMNTVSISVPEDMDQEAVGRIIAENDLMAVPVVDSTGRMKGIVTVDDIVDVVREEATEDIHKFGGMEALDEPYMKISFADMLKKRAGWLTLLFFSEMLTATAMGYFENEIAKAVVLALFIPLIISSGGNSGSQASTLVIRSMALGEIKLRNWFKVLGREIFTGVALGAILGTIGFIRISLWPARVRLYGQHYMIVAVTVALSLIGVVTWGTITGSMLPFILRKLGFDPASASAPFVATLSDVTGLIIYFTVASLILKGTYL